MVYGIFLPASNHFVRHLRRSCGGDVPKTAICRALRPAVTAVQGDPNGATTAAGAVIVLAGEALAA